ncbi:class I SAM-dependent RNA methyltransferase [Fibrobacter sp.]|uniref:THUMP domain-containing class I SAM-dependent RNA methyltransferase n=1 Tax=Fibrobacter sp. TaxID=35828 RepID=UPI00389063EA
MAVAPLGFEETLANELKYIGVECAEEAEIKVTGDGKVEFTAKITEAWKAVAYSRIANRMLMEIGCFKAENFGQLEKHAAEIPWELYIGPRYQAPGKKYQELRDSDLASNVKCHPERSAKESMDLNIHVTCKHSRLYHSDAVEERVRKIIEEKLTEQSKSNFDNHQQQYSKSHPQLSAACHPQQSAACHPRLDRGSSMGATQHLYINLIDDRCTIWQDLAGEELYKRGHERFVAEAPLKETIAAAMIFEACRLLTTGFRSPVSGNFQITIVDPMAGSGTFSLEAAYIANELIPGKCRDFALKYQPAFKEAAWNFLVNRQNSSNFEPFTIITSDISERPISIIKHNVDNSPLKDIYANAGENTIAKIDPQLKDFFSYTIEDFTNVSASHTESSHPDKNQDQQSNGDIVILLNPPYGKRLDFDAPKLYTKIGQKLAEWCSDAKKLKTSITVAILAPKNDPRNGPKYTCSANLLKECPFLDSRHNPNAKIIETSHGGISLNIFIAKST